MTQQDYLRATKAALNADTWDALAEMACVTPRAFKNYRMPESSQAHRKMPGSVKKVFEMLLTQQGKNKVKSV